MKFLPGILILLLLFLPLPLAHTQTLNVKDLTSTQQMIFNRERLAVAVNDIPYVFLIEGSGSGGVIREVSFYQGFNTISESLFYLIAGYETEADIANEHAIVNRNLSIAGWTLFGASAVGLIGMLAMLVDDSDILSSEWDRRFTGWTIFTLSTSLGALIPLFILIDRGDYKFNPQQAITVADQYNRILIESILRK